MAPTTRTRSGNLPPAHELLVGAVSQEGTGKRRDANSRAGVKKAVARTEGVKKTITKEVGKKKVGKKEVAKKKAVEKAATKMPVVAKEAAKKVAKKEAAEKAVAKKEVMEKIEEPVESKKRGRPLKALGPITDGCLVLEPNLEIIASNEEIVCSPLFFDETTPGKTSFGGTTFGNAIVSRSGFVLTRERQHSGKSSIDSAKHRNHIKVGAPTPELGQKARWKVPFDGEKYCIKLNHEVKSLKKKRGRPAKIEPLDGVTYEDDSPFPKILPDGRPLKFMMWDPENEAQHKRVRKETKESAEEKGKDRSPGIRVPWTISHTDASIFSPNWQNSVVSFKQGGHPRETIASAQQGKTKYGWCGEGCRHGHAFCKDCGRISPCEVNRQFPHEHMNPNSKEEIDQINDACVGGGIWCGWRPPNQISPSTAPPLSGDLPADDKVIPRIAETPITDIENGPRKRKGKEKRSPKKALASTNGVTKEANVGHSGSHGCCSTTREITADLGLGIERGRESGEGSMVGQPRKEAKGRSLASKGKVVKKWTGPPIEPVSHSSWETSDVKKYLDLRGEECLARAKADGTFQENVAKLQQEIDDEGATSSWERDAFNEAEAYERQRPYFDATGEIIGTDS